MRADERAFLERSLADLDAEHAAGDLDDADHAALRARYEAKLAAARTAPPAPRTPAFVVGVGAAVVLFAVAAGVLLASSVGRRSADGTITGEDVSAPGTTSVVVPELPAALQACVDLVDGQAAGGDVIDCFQGYTRANPGDPDGWSEFALYVIQEGMAAGGNQDLYDAGEGFLGQALAVDPDNVKARVYLAVFLDRTGRADEAAEQLALLEGADIPPDLQPLVDLVESGVGAAAD